MRNLFFIALFSLSFSVVNAQTFAYLEDYHNRERLHPNNKPDIASMHTNWAVYQISNHLDKHLEYPETMLDYLKETTVNVQVLLTKNGHIFSSQIVGSQQPIFDKAVIKAIQSLDKLDFGIKAYQGHRKFIIPVHFSIDQ